MYCKNCGHIIFGEEKYCGKCGYPVQSNISNARNYTYKSDDEDTYENDNKSFLSKFIKFFIVIIILFIGTVIVVMCFDNVSTVKDNNISSNNTENQTKDDNTNLPIYIGKTYVGKYGDITSYITFTSNTKFRYVSKYNYGNVADVIMDGTYEIDGNTIKSLTVLQGGSMIRENYTIIDKNTIKSSNTTYKVDDN